MNDIAAIPATVAAGNTITMSSSAATFTKDAY